MTYWIMWATSNLVQALGIVAEGMERGLGLKRGPDLGGPGLIVDVAEGACGHRLLV